MRMFVFIEIEKKLKFIEYNTFLGEIQNPQDLDHYIVVRDDIIPKKYACGLCNIFSHPSRSNVRNHLESRHFQGYFSYSCDICGKVLGTNNALEAHRKRCFASTNR